MGLARGGISRAAAEVRFIPAQESAPHWAYAVSIAALCSTRIGTARLRVVRKARARSYALHSPACACACIALAKHDCSAHVHGINDHATCSQLLQRTPTSCVSA
eukprot:2441962-Pleurochrysis_carterae.AAC.4